MSNSMPHPCLTQCHSCHTHVLQHIYWQTYLYIIIVVVVVVIIIIIKWEVE